jgi:hypothetical protein
MSNLLGPAPKQISLEPIAEDEPGNEEINIDDI